MRALARSARRPPPPPGRVPRYAVDHEACTDRPGYLLARYVRIVPHHGTAGGVPDAMASALASDGLLLPGWGWRPDDLRRRGGDAMVPAAQVERRRASSKMMASRSEQVTRAEPSASRLFARHPQGKTDPPPWVLRRGRGFRLTELFLHLVFLLEIGWLALCVLRNRPAIAAIGERCYFLVFVPTIREIRDFYREMQRTNRESITL
eukprot:SAG31_NODE_4988_length_2818_cov_9.534020_1_plen_206_part_00